MENRLKQHDEQQSLKEYSRNKRGDGLLTTGGTIESKTSRVSSARPNKSPTPKKLASARASPDKKKVKLSGKTCRTSTYHICLRNQLVRNFKAKFSDTLDLFSFLK